MYQSFAPRYAVMDGGSIKSDGVKEVMFMNVGEEGS